MNDPRFWLTVGILAMIAIFDGIAFFFQSGLPHDLLVVIITTMAASSWWCSGGLAAPTAAPRKTSR